MQDLKIVGTKDTLTVNFIVESGILTLKGASYPENPVNFFDPLYTWITTYTQEIHNTLTVNMTINYVNTSSSKCLLDFLELLENYHNSGGKITLNWYYEEDDEDMLECGEELCEDLKLPYSMIPIVGNPE